MTLTRWKMMAGVLGLSIGGLAAMADPSQPKADKAAGGKPAPVEIPAPAPGDVPQIAPAVAPAPKLLPPASVDVPTPVVATPADLPLLPQPAPAPKPVAVRDFEFVVPTATPIVVPVANEAAPIMDLTVSEPAAPKPPSVPAPAAPEPVASAPVVPEPPSISPPVVRPEPTPELKPTPPSVATSPALPISTAGATVEKKLKVMLHMGDQRPRFEVKDADEVYLRVVCDKVDVEAPTGKADGQSTLKAMGHCAFVTPGGDGVCDDLTVVPGTGEVVVSGNVRFVYRWGRAETEVSGAKMTFRLGAAPDGMISSADYRDDAPSVGLPKAMPASYTVPR